MLDLLIIFAGMLMRCWLVAHELLRIGGKPMLELGNALPPFAYKVLGTSSRGITQKLLKPCERLSDFSRVYRQRARR
jgi:hypothetical protein